MGQKCHLIRVDPKIKKATAKDVSNHTCPACKFDGKLPVMGRDGTVVNFEKGFVIEYEDGDFSAAHCPACGFWDREVRI